MILQETANFRTLILLGRDPNIHTNFILYTKKGYEPYQLFGKRELFTYREGMGKISLFWRGEHPLKCAV